MSAASPPRKVGVPAALWASAAGLGGCLLWAYWPTLVTLVNRWLTDPQSSYGFIVPLFAAIVLWTRRASFPALSGALEPWGLAVIVAGALVRLGGVYVHFQWFDGFSLLLSLTGAGVLLGGWKLLRWAWPAVVLLLLAVPLPYQAQIALASPLQRAATVSATYALQTLGYPAIAEGNVVVINDLPIGVEEACNGLGMLAAFFALSIAVAFVIQRPLYEKVLVFLSAIPIGLIVNLIRITVMCWAHITFGKHIADALFHDYAGWLMMPLALLALGLELMLLKRLVIQRNAAKPIPVVLPRPTAPATPLAATDRPNARTRPAQPAPVADGPRGR